MIQLLLNSFLFYFKNAYSMTLADLKPDDVAVIDEIHNGDLSPKAMRRFREMGLMRGTEIKMVRYAPLKDPIEILVRGALFSIRIEDAVNIIVSKKTD